MMNQNKESPLLPITDLMSNDVSKTVSFVSERVDRAVSEGMTKVKGEESERILNILTDEISKLSTTQEKNNEEIKKRVADVQSLRENNLVIAGAVSGLKKMVQEINKI